MTLLVCDTYQIEEGGIQPFLQFLYQKAIEHGDFSTETWVVVAKLPEEWEDTPQEGKVEIDIEEGATPEETMAAMESYFASINTISSEVREASFQVKQYFDSAVLPFQLRRLEYFPDEAYLHLVFTPTDLLDV